MIEGLRSTISKEQLEIIRAALYFDVFKYPLTQEELFECTAIITSRETFSHEISQLISSGILKKEGDFILINDLSTENITRRKLGNEGASQIMPTAYKYSQIIASFPFVEGVCLSGALSKKYYDEHGDLDFFIITKPNRLWLCRTFLILRYKLLPKHKKKFWCTNYFISSDDMVLPDINSFTATELAFLIPSVNYATYKKLLESNSWYQYHFPNKPLASEQDCLPVTQNVLKTITEFLLSGKLGNWIDNKLLNYTLHHWQKKYPELASEDFELQFRSQKNVCKRHTKGFQNKVLNTWFQKQKEFEQQFNISFQDK